MKGSSAGGCSHRALRCQRRLARTVSLCAAPHCCKCAEPTRDGLPPPAGRVKQGKLTNEEVLRREVPWSAYQVGPPLLRRVV